MHKTSALILALLLIVALSAAALAQDALGVDTLIPAACSAISGAQPITLYFGPTQGFYRPGEQTLDPAAPYVYFGQFDCWSMVAQGTPEAFGPVGWVETALMDVIPNAPELAFDDALTAMVEEDAPAADSPMGGSLLSTLPRGAQVIILAQYGDALYVQADIDGVPARVFIPAAAVL